MNVVSVRLEPFGVMGIVSNWIGQHIGVVSWIPGVVFICQCLLSGFLLLLTFAGVLLLPGKLLKLGSLVVGLIAIIIVWYL